VGQDLAARIKELSAQGHKDWKIEQILKSEGHDITRHRIRCIYEGLRKVVGHNISIDEDGDSAEVSGVVEAESKTKSLDQLLKLAEVDMDAWYVKRWIANTWAGNWQVKAWLYRKTHEERNLEALITRLEELSPVEPSKWRLFQHNIGQQRALEISVMDPHFGMRAFSPASGHEYSHTIAEDLWWNGIEMLLERARPFGPFWQICFVAGNDFLHADNVFHTTTEGTGQPEMESWHHTFAKGEEMLIATVLRLKKIAPVHVVMVPGNHARQSEFALGRILNAYFRNDEDVSVDCSPAPYKFWNFGCNLVGFEHGHSIKPNKLASLMASECADVWSDKVWQREWHCGDQHRESVTFSEFGVNIKFLPSMVTWNEWHKIKGFSWQHRASLGFVYDAECGLISTPQVNARELYGRA
jgi:ribonuclease HI